MTKEKRSYNDLSQELDVILGQLQAGNLDVDDAIQKYKRGNEIIEQLETYLTEAENTITSLQQSFEE